MRGCSPLCLLRSMSSTAFAEAARAACLMGPGSPTKLMTERLWSGFDSTSRRVTPGVDLIASAIELITSCRRPSLKFGTHSMSFNLLLPCLGSVFWVLKSERPLTIWFQASVFENEAHDRLSRQRLGVGSGGFLLLENDDSLSEIASRLL